MKKQIILSVFLLLLKCCSVSLAQSPATSVTTKNFNILLFDEIKDSSKLVDEALSGKDVHHIFDFPFNYSKKEKMLRKNLDAGLKEIKENEIVPAGSPNIIRLQKKNGNIIEYSYYTHSATDRSDGTLQGMFLDYFVEPKLLNDPRVLADFKVWFEGVLLDWGKENNVVWMILRDSSGNFWLKLHAEVYPE